MRKSFRLVLALGLILASHLAFSQTVPFPTGNRDFYDISPWGYTNAGTNNQWDTSPYIPFIYQDMWYRMMPPNGVTYIPGTNQFNNSQPGKLYPLILFFQGAGETGTDNNKQLLHGGQLHRDSVLNGKFPGFLLYPQSVDYFKAKLLIDKIIERYPIDINRIYVHGLSNGAVWTWKFTVLNPTLVAAISPCSGVVTESTDPDLLYTPVRLAQGGLDTNPAPNWTQTIVDWYKNNGGHLDYFYFPTLGHGTWNTMYQRNDWFKWFKASKKNKIQVLFSRYELCDTDPINVTMGFTPGFDAYEWRKDGVLMTGETLHKITATSYGSYTGRIKNRGVWSEWSDPIVVKVKDAINTPVPTLVGSQSLYVPDINGNSNVNVTLPAGYETYAYYKNGSPTAFATTQAATLSGAGSYTAKVKEVGGCASNVSTPLLVVDVAGNPKPDPVSNVVATGISKTQIRLTWEQNTTPVTNETGFEIWRSESSTGPFVLVTKTAADILLYNDTGLTSDTYFYYKIRPVAANGAAAASAVASAKTDLDITPPTPPNNLTVGTITSTSVALSWAASTDDVGVVGYDVYVKPSTSSNYIKAYTTTALTQTVFSLSTGVIYNFVVRARDEQGNTSNASAMAVAATYVTGLSYSYYEGTWTALPNFSSLTPIKTGVINNFSLTPKNRADNFGMVFTGTLQIPTTGNYTFFTTSDDGSKLYINNNLVVNNDGLHGATEKASSVIALTAGFYPIRAEFFEATGGESLEVRWQGPSISKQLIPDSRLRENSVLPAAPTAPTSLSMTVIDYKSLRVNWAAYNGTGTEIEIYRSTNNSTWNIINTVPKTAVNYVDASGLSANTRYYYRLRAINSGNVSAFTSSVNAFTAQLPALPANPTLLALAAPSVNSVSMTWKDNATTEDNYEVYKSTGNNTGYTKIATLPANTQAYTDNSLFAHTLYYYKVLARNVRGPAAAYTNEVSTTSLNTTPVLSGVTNVTLRYDETLTIPLTATDVDNDFLVIGGVNLPEWVQLFDDGTGDGLITITPNQSLVGTYPGLQIYAADQYGGQHTVTFQITVSSNHSPVIAAVPAQSMNETNTLQLTATATDADNDPITWSVLNAPAFMTTTPNGSSLQINFTPGATDAGNYTITLKATDPNNGTTTQSLSLTVNDYDPNYNVRVNFRSSSAADGPTGLNGWNNVDYTASTYTLTKDDLLSTQSGISLQMMGTNWDVTFKDANGVVPGVYPTTVQNSYIGFWNGNGPKTIRLTGMNAQGKYNLKFLASSSAAIFGASTSATITVAGSSQTINAVGNANTLLTFSAVQPLSDGSLNVTVAGPTGGYGLLNAMVIESYYEGTTPPPAPSGLDVSITSTQDIAVTWTDNSVNEQSFQIWRSTDNNTFTQIGTADKNIITYTDLTGVVGTTYYYKVRAVNTFGASSYTNTKSVVAPNRIPVVAPISPIYIPEMDMQWITVSAVDGDGDPLTFSLANEPAFAWIEYVDDTRSNIVFAPSQGDSGPYTFQLICDDIHGARTTTNISLMITSINDVEYRVNFTIPQVLAGAPWNNVTSFAQGTVLNSLVNSNNVASGVSLNLQTAWFGTNPNGNTTGNNSGLYPDAVMSNSFYVQDNGARTILMSGLRTDRAYDFTFFASRMGVADVRNTIYTIGAKSATLNASGNISNTAKVVAVHPNASGQVTISIAKEAASSFGYLGAMVIREYVEVIIPTAPAAPTGIVTQVLSRSSMRINWTDASDNETGFEIWRSVGNNTSYSLLTTTAANATTFTNTGLATSTTYYYKVRAINAVGPSAYTSESSGTTFDFAVSLNFNAFSGSPANWNGFPAHLITGSTTNNLIDDTGVNTGISMTVVKEFTGTNEFGMNTGNNSGIVPDNVMLGAEYLDPRADATLRFGGLSFLKKYNFSFFGSRNGGGDRTTVYTINGVSVTLNASFNTANIAQIKDVVPAIDGTITISISNTLTASFGYLNGLIIQAVPNNGGRIAADLSESNPTTGQSVSLIQASPNPFNNKVTLSVGEDFGAFHVNLVSTTGNVVYNKSFDHEPGRTEVELLLDEQLSDGIYVLRVSNTTGVTQSVKLLKR